MGKWKATGGNAGKAVTEMMEGVLNAVTKQTDEGVEIVAKNLSKNVSSKADDLVAKNRARAAELRKKHGVRKDPSTIAPLEKKATVEMTDELKNIRKNQNNLEDVIGGPSSGYSVEATEKALESQRKSFNATQQQYNDYKAFKKSDEYKKMSSSERIAFNEKSQGLVDSYNVEKQSLSRMQDSLGQAQNNAALGEMRDIWSNGKGNMSLDEMNYMTDLENKMIRKPSAFNSDGFNDYQKRNKVDEASFISREKTAQRKKKMQDTRVKTDSPSGGNASATNTDPKGNGSNYVYNMAAMGVGGGLVLSMFNNRGQQSNQQLYGQGY